MTANVVDHHDNPHVDDLLALYALGALEPQEMVEIEAHLVVCSRCRLLADAARATVAQLAYSVAPVTPRPDTKRQLLQRIAAEPAPAQVMSIPAPGSSRSARSAPPPSRWRGLRAWGPALAFAALALVLLGWNLMLQRENATQRQQWAAAQAQVESLRQQLDQAQADNRTLTTEIEHLKPMTQQLDTIQIRFPGSETANTIQVLVPKLFPLQPGQNYQLWLIPQTGTPISLNCLQPSGQVNGEVQTQLPLSQAKAIAISLELNGCQPQPTQPILLPWSFLHG